MLLRRITEHVKTQNWTAVAIDFVIVVVGVFGFIPAQGRQSASGSTNWAGGLSVAMDSDLNEIAIHSSG